jgi:hypothetical protein
VREWNQPHGFFLEVFDRHEEDSPGTNREKMDVIRIVLLLMD